VGDVMLYHSFIAGDWMLKGCMRSFMRATTGTSNAIQYLYILASSSPRQIATRHGIRS
jgi:hypothetical protein